ncbi:MAG: phosphoglucomutase/phosphomannomutase family protein [Elusimicrobiota bacterium]
MNAKIKFGTDGWRDVIADGFTFGNLKNVVQATCQYLKKTSKSKYVLIGYDNRFYSDQFARIAAQVFLANSFKVELSDAAVSSPVMSWNTKNKKAALGVMITASHNPAIFNGYKLKGSHGGSVDEKTTLQIEDLLDLPLNWDESIVPKTTDFVESYIGQLKKWVDPKKLKGLKGKIVFDSMHGPGGEIFKECVGSSFDVSYLHNNRDPLFGGINPEPIEENLLPLKAEMKTKSAVIGIAVDGDADRIGVIDEKGRYLPPHTVMPLLLCHLVKNKKMKGKVIQTVSMGYINQRICQKYGLAFEEVPVGFKNIVQKMLIEKVLWGGEESGGYGVGLWTPERDGLMCALLLIEMLVMEKKPLSQIVDEMSSQFGSSHFKRVDFHLKESVNKADWTVFIQSQLKPEISGQKIKSVNSSDGIKIITENDSWVLMRPSGTEPLIRTYSESDSMATVDALLNEAKRLVSIQYPPKKIESKSGTRKSRKPKE